jgi:hypothetical protein
MCRGWLGASVMQCRACGAEMRLMQVIVGDALRWAPAIERQIFKCPTCPHVAQRLVFGALPISASVATHPDERAIKVRTQPRAEPRLTATLNGRQPAEIAAAARNSNWSRAVEKLRRRQAALKAAATPLGAFHKLRNGVQHQGGQHQTEQERYQP